MKKYLIIAMALLLTSCFGSRKINRSTDISTSIRTEETTHTKTNLNTVASGSESTVSNEIIDEEEATTVTDYDTVSVDVIVPIERKEYSTDDYHCTIEGYKPELIDLTLFPKTTTITNTEIRTITKRHKWGVGIQVGYGITPNRIEPYIGVGISYNLWTW